MSDEPTIIEFDTERLRVRQWSEPDREPFAALNADPRVMKYFLAPLSRAESDALADRFEALIRKRGWGVWAVDEKSSDEFIGFVGLHVPPDNFPFAPCVEVAWRLAVRYWGKGYATEAARAALETGFETLNLDEIVAYTAVGNARSRAVMKKLGMQLAEATFEHPSLPATSCLRKQCLYRLQQNNSWQTSQKKPAPLFINSSWE